MKPTHKTVYTMEIKTGTTCVVGSSATAGTSHWRSAVLRRCLINRSLGPCSTRIYKRLHYF